MQVNQRDINLEREREREIDGWSGLNTEKFGKQAQQSCLLRALCLWFID